MITGSVVMQSLGGLAQSRGALIPEYSVPRSELIHVILSKLYFKQSQIIYSPIKHSL